MAAPGDPSEFGIAALVLGASGLALVMSLRSIGRLLSDRARSTGRQITDAEIDAILAAASAAPALIERLAEVERTLPAILERLDDIAAQCRRRRITDGP